MATDSANPPLVKNLLDLEARLATAINQVADAEFTPYLKEAWHCFNSGAQSATILCTWSAVSAYVKRAVLNVALGKELFAFRCGNLKKKPHRSQDTEEEQGVVTKTGELNWQSIGDTKMIETCREMGILRLDESHSVVYDWSITALKRRNEIAHDPWALESSDEFQAREEVVQYVEGAVRHFLSTSVTKHISANVATILEFIRHQETEIPNEQRTALANGLVNPDDILFFYNGLYSTYRSPRDRNNKENAKAFLPLVYEKLGDRQCEIFANRGVEEMAHTVGYHAELRGNRWIYSQRCEKRGDQDVPIAPSEPEFSDLLALKIWTDRRLSIHHRKGFYKAIVHFLDWEIEEKKTTDLSARQFNDLREFAPNKVYRTMVEKRRTELQQPVNLQGVSHDNPSS